MTHENTVSQYFNAFTYDNSCHLLAGWFWVYDLAIYSEILKNGIKPALMFCCILGGRFCQVHEGPLKPWGYTPSSPCGPPRETVGRHQGHGEPTFPNSLKLWHLHSGSQIRPCHVLCTLWVHLQFVFYFFYWFKFCSKIRLIIIFIYIVVMNILVTVDIS